MPARRAPMSIAACLLAASCLPAPSAGAAADPAPGPGDAAPAAAPAARPLLVTVDDLPIAAGRLHADPEERAAITRGLLAALARHHVPAVGFVIWGQVAGPGDLALLGRWLDAGHELGNHSFGHLDLTRTEVETFLADVEKGR